MPILTKWTKTHICLIYLVLKARLAAFCRAVVGVAVHRIGTAAHQSIACPVLCGVIARRIAS